jgi:hypothetical protein
MDLITLDSLMAYWGISMVALGAIVALVFATTAMAKQHFGLQGKANLIVSGGASVVWSLLIALPAGAKPTTCIAYMVIGFMVSSGGWQAFKDILEKGGEKFAGFKPGGAGDRLIDK